MVSAHPVLEAVLLELKRPRILADDPHLVLREATLLGAEISTVISISMP
jgi:hypothetical protein